MSEWYLNGDACDVISINSRGMQYGDGLFETVAVRDGKPRLWVLHMERLLSGCKRLGLDAPETEPLRSLIEGQGEAYGVAKIVVSARAADRGYARARGKVDVALRTYAAAPLPTTVFEHGADVMICETKLARGSTTAGIKTLNRLEQVLARNEVSAGACFEGLTRDADDRLICGTMSNLFVVKDDRIITPDLSECGVAGVMRRHIIETLSASQLEVAVSDIERLDDVQEVFLSNSQFGVLPVRSCGDDNWSVGPVTREVVARLGRNGIQEWSL